MTAQPQKNNAPHPRSCDDPLHPQRCPDCDPGDRIGRYLHDLRKENRDILCYQEPRGTWPFDLVRLSDAIAICENKYHLAIPEMNDPVSESETGVCRVCGTVAYYTRLIKRGTVSPTRWMRLYRHLRTRVAPCNAENIIGLVERYHFCSRECHASAVLWSLYLPVSFAQLLRIPFLFPRWAVEDARERRKAEERHQRFKQNMDKLVIRVGPDTG